MAEQLGDRRWRAALDLHGSLARDCVEGRGGNLVRSTGDGVLATFEGPGRAIRSAAELREGLGRADLDIRTGIHTGEVEMRGGGIDGIAVHLAARIMAGAAAGGVLVSRTVRDLVVGSRIVFEDRGAHSMKGIEGDWQLYSVVDA